ncbi:MAG: RluA family pseudouridine synthase [Rubrivivax sp.]|nr:RluA family pseudouridine synthase [Rubrivivax sp.]MCL4698556.1 RluA family pseudouridine synthase [Burkholderiaceae bacterium]
MPSSPAGSRCDDRDDEAARAVEADIDSASDVIDEAAGETACDAADEAPIECRRAVVTAGQHGQRLDKVLAALAPEFSRSHVQHLIDGGHAQLQGQPARVPSRKVRAGDELALELVPTDESRAFRAEPAMREQLVIVHEDEHLLVVHKPAGLVVHPAAGHWSGTLLNALLAHHAGAAALPRAGIVHRLDKDTSGLMLVGKTLPAVTALVRDIAARDVQRLYVALAWGHVPDELSIDEPIGRDPRSRLRMAVVSTARGGRVARTDVQCVARGEGAGALRCRLHTGRTHQIRVHLASGGWPLVGDSLYGGRAGFGLERQALHAVRLALLHPLTRQPLAFHAPPPPDFARAWEQVAGATMAAD